MTERIQSKRRLLVLILTAVPLLACQQPIYQVNRPIIPPAGSQLSLANVELSILRAAKARHWSITRESESRLLARKRFKRRIAAVTIDYDRDSFKIKYRPTKTWAARETTDPDTGESQVLIHRRYNSLVRRLEKEINRQLKSPSLQRVERPAIPRTSDVIDGDQRLGSTGTGFFVSQGGMLVTNHHVISSCVSYKIRTLPSGQHRARLVATDRSADLALLKTDYTPNHIATLRSGRSVRLGDPVTVFGFPLTGILSSQGVVTTGNISALRGFRNESDDVQISAAVQPGNSGGPLFDDAGNVVGVVYSKLNAVGVAMVTGDIPQNVNFAIKRFTLENFLSVHDVEYRTQRSNKLLSIADIVEKARKFTVRVECWQ